jgi:molecular chaperone HscB
MNYFELYDTPISYNIDQVALKQKYIALSRLHHPDYQVQNSEQKQAEEQLKTIDVNAGFQILKHNTKRLYYILELKGIVAENEKYALPSAFLMDMMELNEQLESVDNTTLEQVRSEVDALEMALNISLYQQAASIDWNEITAAIASELKEIYFKLKYILRIKESLNTFAARL